MCYLALTKSCTQKLKFPNSWNYIANKLNAPKDLGSAKVMGLIINFGVGWWHVPKTGH